MFTPLPDILQGTFLDDVKFVEGIMLVTFLFLPRLKWEKQKDRHHCLHFNTDKYILSPRPHRQGVRQVDTGMHGEALSSNHSHTSVRNELE